MRNIVAIILLVAFTALATGMPQRIHQRQHECRDCRLALLEKIRHNRPSQTPAKSQSNDPCQLCTLLHAPVVGTSVPLIPVDAGAAPGAIIQIQCQPVALASPVQLPCRGPPVC
jgi:hypothetical protein